MLERVLVPLDGSESSELAVRYAGELAARLHSEVSLLYVGETSDPKHRHVFEAYLETVSKRLIETVKRTYGSPDVMVKTIVVEGSPAAEIMGFAEKNDTGLIIMASHGRSGLMPWPVGSTAAKVSQHARVPVLLVRAGNPPYERLFDKLLVPLDGSDAGEAAIPYIIELAHQIQMEVILLGVIASGQHVHTIGGLNYVTFPEPLIQRMQLEASQYLERIRGKLSGTRAVVKCEVRLGDPASEILKFSAENGVNLVAMSSHGHSGIERWMLGSVSYKVLHSGKTPLLLVKAPPKTQV